MTSHRMNLINPQRGIEVNPWSITKVLPKNLLNYISHLGDMNTTFVFQSVSSYSNTPPHPQLLYVFHQSNPSFSSDRNIINSSVHDILRQPICRKGQIYHKIPILAVARVVDLAGWSKYAQIIWFPKANTGYSLFIHGGVSFFWQTKRRGLP